jgi:hypothetical protein
MDIVKKESMAMCKAEIADFAESLPLLCARMRACACALACVLPLDVFGRARARGARARRLASAHAPSATRRRHVGLCPTSILTSTSFVRRCAAANNIFVIFNCRCARAVPRRARTHTHTCTHALGAPPHVCPARHPSGIHVSACLHMRVWTGHKTAR